MNTTTVTHDGRLLTVERVINASQANVWNAYAVAEIFERWFAPHDWTTTVKNFDFRPGGYCHYTMVHNTQNHRAWSKSVYAAISPIDRIVYTDYFCDETGKPIKDMPVTEVRVFLEAIDNHTTKITSTSTFASEDELEIVLKMGVVAGIKQTFEKLAKVVE